MATNMYAGAKTWSPFCGCDFDCVYCRPSFQAQAKRQKHRCGKCYRYQPHTHSERLTKIPNSEIVFVCGNGDISFCPPAFTRRIIEAIRWHGARHPKTTYYLQSKRPEYFQQFLRELGDHTILVTTLETNRDEGYEAISKAPPPSERYEQFKALDYPRKVVTVEPMLDMDPRQFAWQIAALSPECVWVGFNSRPKQVQLPEPDLTTVRVFLAFLRSRGVEVRGKDLRGLEG